MDTWFDFDDDSPSLTGAFAASRLSRCSVTASTRTTAATATSRTARATMTASALTHERVVSILEEARFQRPPAPVSRVSSRAAREARPRTTATPRATPATPARVSEVSPTPRVPERFVSGRRVAEMAQASPSPERFASSRAASESPAAPRGPERFASGRRELAERFRSLMENSRDDDFNFDLTSVDGAPFPHWELEELKRKFQALREENFKLQAVITDVTEVNKRWQKYNNDRQLYVQKLLNLIQEQQEQMNKLVQERVVISKEMCEKAVGDAGVGAAGEAAMLLSVPPSVEAILKERNQLRDTVSRLGFQLEKTRDEHTQHVELLQYQLKSHQNDWEAERSEKFQALSAKDAADRRVRELQRDLKTLKQKFREEKLQSFNHCKCCEAHVNEYDQCNIFLPGSQVNMCRKNHAKTYRTSVHVPCTSSPLLPRGTTLFFSDDLVVDGENNEGAKVSELSEVSKISDDIEEKLCIDDKELNDHVLSKDTEDPRPISSSSEVKKFDGNNNSPKSGLPEEFPACKDGMSTFNIVDNEMETDSWEVLERKSSAKELNIEQDCCEANSLPSGTVTPSTSTSSISMLPSNIVTEDEGLVSSGVTIGFDDSGLASVTGFSNLPIAKSSSLPEKKELRKEGVYPLVSRWSFDSYYTALPIVRPPSSHNFATSMDSLIKSSHFRKPTSSSPLKDVVLPQSTHRPRVQKVKYSEEGVATQTEDDVICPGCGQIFPPKMHLKFLDHFELCQNNGDQKRTKN